MCSLGSCPVHPIQSQQVEMAVHTLGSVHPPLGTIRRPPEFARCCTALSACLCTQQITSVTPSPQQLSSLLGLPSTCQDLTCDPSFSCQGEGCCMPHGACTLLGGPTNSPQRLLVAVYIATAVFPTPCRATAIWNRPQVMQQAPTIKMTAGAQVSATELAHCSIQLHGQPTALSQLFLFSPSK